MNLQALPDRVMVQQDLSGRVLAPEGIQVFGDAISREAEEALLCDIGAHERAHWSHPVLRGRAARRESVSYGREYDYESREALPGAEMPAHLLRARARVAEEVHVDERILEQVLVQRYPPGAGIGAHRDSPAFGEPVVGLSLLGEARLVMHGPRGARFETRLRPRSVYALRGEARWVWTHEIPPVKEERLSLTFRPIAMGGVLEGSGAGGI